MAYAALVCGYLRLQPDYFLITGVDGARSAFTDSRVAVNMSVGQTLLVRCITAGYCRSSATSAA